MFLCVFTRTQIVTRSSMLYIYSWKVPGVGGDNKLSLLLPPVSGSVSYCCSDSMLL